MTILSLLRVRTRLAAAFALGAVVGHRACRRRAVAARTTGASTDSGDAGRIEAANAAAAALFGVPVEQMQGCVLSRFIIRPDADTAQAGPSRQRARLARSNDELRQLSSALQAIREQERTHIARELHDDLGQILASLRMDLALLAQAGAGTDQQARLMDAMQTNLATAIASLRRIATNLRPSALDNGGLYIALQGLRAEFARRYGIACALYADEAELQLDDIASTTVFRIVQEALSNIARHANAHQVTLNVYRLNGDLLITVRDDGRGIMPADMAKAGSLGLIGMRERVWGMHGDIVVSSDEPPGTRIDIILPIRDHQL
jgi:signal transduction histidine kinase